MTNHLSDFHTQPRQINRRTDLLKQMHFFFDFDHANVKQFRHFNEIFSFCKIVGFLGEIEIYFSIQTTTVNSSLNRIHQTQQKLVIKTSTYLCNPCYLDPKHTIINWLFQGCNLDTSLEGELSISQISTPVLRLNFHKLNQKLTLVVVSYGTLTYVLRSVEKDKKEIAISQLDRKASISSIV